MKKKSRSLLKKSKNKLSLKNQIEVLNNICLFINRGYSLNETLNILKYRFNLEKLIQELSNGESIASYLKATSCDKDAKLIISIAENTGELKQGLNNATSLLRQKEATKQQVNDLIRYPIFLLIIIFGTCLFMGYVLIPQFEMIYISFGMEKTTFVATLFTLIKLSPLIMLLILLFIAVIIVIIQRSKTPKNQKQLMKYPLLGNAYKKVYNQVFVYNLLNLLQLNIPLDQSLTILEHQENNILLSSEAIRINQALHQGNALYEAIDSYMYSDELVAIVKDGESNGNLLFNLQNFIELSMLSQERSSKRILFLMQPIFYLVLGVLIILMYSAIFGPMFSMLDAL